MRRTDESTELVMMPGPEDRAVGLPAHPVLVAAGPRVVERVIEWFVVTIRNKNTRAAYLRALRPYLDFLGGHELELEEVRPVHVAAYIEQLTEVQQRAPTTVKQHLAAIRRLYGWLVTGGQLERR